MVSWIRRQRSATDGNAPVQFALVLPILLAFFLGVIEFGRILYIKQVITKAAQKSARAAATEFESYITAANKILLPAGVTPDSIKVKKTKAASPTATTSYEVKISSKVAYITPIGPVLGLIGGGGLGKNIKLTSTAAMRQ